MAKDFTTPSPTCEVWTGTTSATACGEAATHCYPAMGGGWMSLCAEHSVKHLKYCVTFEQAKRGERPDAR